MGPGRCVGIGSARRDGGRGGDRSWPLDCGTARGPAPRPRRSPSWRSSTSGFATHHLPEAAIDLGGQRHPRHGEVAGGVARGHVAEVDDRGDPSAVDEQVAAGGRRRGATPADRPTGPPSRPPDATRRSWRLPGSIVGTDPVEPGGGARPPGPPGARLGTGCRGAPSRWAGRCTERRGTSTSCRAGVGLSRRGGAWLDSVGRPAERAHGPWLHGVACSPRNRALAGTGTGLAGLGATGSHLLRRRIRPATVDAPRMAAPASRRAPVDVVWPAYGATRPTRQRWRGPGAAPSTSP